MQRRSLLSASLGLFAVAGWAGSGWHPARQPEGQAPVPPASGDWRVHQRQGRALGTQVVFTVLHADEAVAAAATADALAAVQRVDRLMSLYRDDSQVARLNRDGVLDAPDPMLLDVLSEAQRLAAWTGGAFDITVQPLWQAHADARESGGLPAAGALAAARARVGWRHLSVSPERVGFGRPGMAITLNGLAQGQAVDAAMAALKRHGIRHALLDTGEFGALGHKAHGEPWRLGIRDPRDTDTVAARLRMDGRALSTSGDYETVFSADFAHHHIFDPATGDSPAALASATVLAPTGLRADGLSTAAMVLGPARAMALAAGLPGVDLLLIGKDGRRWQTPGLAPLLG